MSIFSSPAPAASPVPAQRRRTDSNAMTIIAPDMVVTGHLKADGVVRIEGRVTGNVTAENQILLSVGGVIEGDLSTREAILAGEVRGTVTATERVELQATSIVHGDLATPRLLIQEGGRLNGALRMDAPAIAANNANE
jgi:cytoskeletal protein CcmA (bactofilin family)